MAAGSQGGKRGRHRHLSPQPLFLPLGGDRALTLPSQSLKEMKASGIHESR